MKSFQKAMRSRQITDVSLFRDWSEIKHKIEQNIT